MNIDYNKYIKSINKKDIQDDIDNLTSDKDMKNYLGNNIDKHIITYPELKNYRYITYLLKYDGDFKIILWLQQPNSGHWTLLLRYNNIIEHFDAYGEPPLYSLNYSKDVNEQLDQYPEYYTKLLNQNKFKVIYNTYKFQSSNNNISTCGRHLLLRLIYFKCNKYNLEQYIDKFLRLKKKYKDLSNDQLITKLIPIEDDDININFK